MATRKKGETSSQGEGQPKTSRAKDAQLIKTNIQRIQTLIAPTAQGTLGQAALHEVRSLYGATKKQTITDATVKTLTGLVALVPFDDQPIDEPREAGPQKRTHVRISHMEGRLAEAGIAQDIADMSKGEFLEFAKTVPPLVARDVLILLGQNGYPEDTVFNVEVALAQRQLHNLIGLSTETHWLDDAFTDAVHGLRVATNPGLTGLPDYNTQAIPLVDSPQAGQVLFDLLQELMTSQHARNDTFTGLTSLAHSPLNVLIDALELYVTTNAVVPERAENILVLVPHVDELRQWAMELYTRYTTQVHEDEARKALRDAVYARRVAEWQVRDWEQNSNYSAFQRCIDGIQSFIDQNPTRR